MAFRCPNCAHEIHYINNQKSEKRGYTRRITESDVAPVKQMIDALVGEFTLDQLCALYNDDTLTKMQLAVRINALGHKSKVVRQGDFTRRVYEFIHHSTT